MEKNTKILIGAGALALAYYLYNARKASAAVIPITTTPIAPITTTSIAPITTTPVAPITTTPVAKVVTTPAVDYAAQIAAADAAAKAAQVEIDRLAKVQYQQEENARQQAIMEAQNKANQEAYLKAQADTLAKLEEQKVDAAKIIADQTAADALSHFVYGPPACPDKYEWYNGSCMPSYMVQQMKLTAQANNGEGYIFHDYSNNTTTLVKNCPSGYVKQGVECVPASALSQQQLQEIAMKDAGMVQTSDGQWYTSSTAAATAQAIIDASKITPVYSDRQKNINAAICAVNTSGYINQPNSTINGMSLNQYIGQYQVTASELGIARASCPNSVYSSGRIAGGITNDTALGYVSPSGYTNSIKTALMPPNMGVANIY